MTKLPLVIAVAVIGGVGWQLHDRQRLVAQQQVELPKLTPLMALPGAPGRGR